MNEARPDSPADLLDTAVHLVNVSAGHDYRTLTAVQTLFTSGAPLRPEVFLPVLLVSQA
jgi:hypothetical protein